MPSTGAGEMRLGGRGPLHGPILGGEREIRTPDGDEHAPLPTRRSDAAGSTLAGNLHKETLETTSSGGGDEDLSQKRLAGVGNPASSQKRWRMSSSERAARA